MKLNENTSLEDLNLPSNYLNAVLEDVFLYPPQNLSISRPLPATIRELAEYTELSIDDTIRRLKEIMKWFSQSALNHQHYEALLEDQSSIIFLRDQDLKRKLKTSYSTKIKVFDPVFFRNQIKDFKKSNETVVIFDPDLITAFRTCMYLRNRGISSFFMS